MRVLLVDDNPDNLKLLGALLNSCGIDSDWCISGDEALEQVCVREYKAIFLDHMMPNMDGMETARELRVAKIEWLKGIPIIAMMTTITTMSGVRDMFIRNGFNDLLAKPVRIHQVKEIISKWLTQG